MRRGFSLLELLIAMAIGAFGIAIAARLVRTAVRSTGRGNQMTEMQANARLLGAQIRADLDLAGLGSTGAIAVDEGQPPWNRLFAATTGAGFPSIPAVRGASNATGDFPAAAGGVGILEGSDVIQVVVPDPATLQITDRTSPAPGRQLFVDPPGCAFVYITDHSAPNGAGRTQIARVNPINSNPILLQDDLRFPVYEGSDVMCARISTYWVDAERWLHRTDMTDAVALAVGTTGIFSTPTDRFSDRVVFGVDDLQIAYRFSSELAGRGAALDDRWAFDSTTPGGGLDNTVRITGARAWFEVRQVRLTMLLRTARRVDDPQGTAIAEGGGDLLEDRATPRPIDKSFGRYLLKTSSVLVNLRYFDQNAPSGLAAEPY